MPASGAHVPTRVETCFAQLASSQMRAGCDRCLAFIQPTTSFIRWLARRVTGRYLLLVWLRLFVALL